jgi:hypothetical protein
MRTIVDLPEEQLDALAEICAREGISRAEAIRRAVKAFLAERQLRRQERKDALDATFGMWKDRGVDTDTYLAKIRAEGELGRTAQR